jgi:hypothetical protein
MGGQVGVGEHDLLGLKIFVRVGNQRGFTLGSPVKEVAAPYGDGAVALIGGDPVDVGVVHPLGGPEKRGAIHPVGVVQEIAVAPDLIGHRA